MYLHETHHVVQVSVTVDLPFSNALPPVKFAVVVRQGVESWLR